LRVHYAYKVTTQGERRLQQARLLFDAAKRLERNGGRESDRRLWQQHVTVAGDVTIVRLGPNPTARDGQEWERAITVARPPSPRPWQSSDVQRLYPRAIEAIYPSGAEMAEVLYAGVRVFVRAALKGHVGVDFVDGTLQPVALDEYGAEVLGMAQLLEQAEDATLPQSSHTCLADGCERTLEGAQRTSRSYCSQRCQKREYRAQLRSGRRQTVVRDSGSRAPEKTTV